MSEWAPVSYLISPELSHVQYTPGAFGGQNMALMTPELHLASFSGNIDNIPTRMPVCWISCCKDGSGNQVSRSMPGWSCLLRSA